MQYCELLGIENAADHEKAVFDYTRMFLTTYALWIATLVGFRPAMEKQEPEGARQRPPRPSHLLGDGADLRHCWSRVGAMNEILIAVVGVCIGIALSVVQHHLRRNRDAAATNSRSGRQGQRSSPPSAPVELASGTVKLTEG